MRRPNRHNPGNAVRLRGPQLRGDQPAHRVPDDDRAGDLQRVHGAQHVGRDAVDAHGIAGVGRAAGAVRVQRDAAVVVLQEREDAVVVVLRRAQAVDED